jgi:hypothetical protein
MLPAWRSCDYKVAAEPTAASCMYCCSIRVIPTTPAVVAAAAAADCPGLDMDSGGCHGGCGDPDHQTAGASAMEARQ